MHAKNLIGFTLILMYLGTSTLVFAEAGVTSERGSTVYEEPSFAELMQKRREHLRYDNEDTDDEEEEEWKEEPTVTKRVVEPEEETYVPTEVEVPYREKKQSYSQKVKDRWLSFKAKAQYRRRLLSRKMADIKMRIRQTQNDMQRRELEKEKAQMQRKFDDWLAAEKAGPEMMETMKKRVEEREAESIHKAVQKYQEEEKLEQEQEARHKREETLRKRPLPKTPPKQEKEQELAPWQKEMRERIKGKETTY